MTPNPLIEFKDVTKRFKQTVALNSVSFQASVGECIYLLGANGSGKSTLLKIIAGLISCDKGTVTRAKHSDLFYVSASPGLYASLTVSENINLIIGKTDTKDLLSEWDLHKHKDDLISSLSSGLQMRVGLLVAFLFAQNNKAPVILLDEPTAFFDDWTVGVFNRNLELIQDKALVIIATHDTQRINNKKAKCLNLKNGSLTT